MSVLHNIYYSDPIIDITERLSVFYLLDHYVSFLQIPSYGSEVRKEFCQEENGSNVFVTARLSKILRSSHLP